MKLRLKLTWQPVAQIAFAICATERPGSLTWCYVAECAARTKPLLRSWNQIAIVVTVLVLFTVPAAAQEYVCKHNAGSYSFRSENVAVSKDGSHVIVRSLDHQGNLSDDFWSYRVVAEHLTVGFRAIRLGQESRIPSDSVFDIALGGELIVLSKEDEITAVFVGTNATNYAVETESLGCILQP